MPKKEIEAFRVRNKAEITKEILRRFGTLEEFSKESGLDYETIVRGLITTNYCHITLIETLRDYGIEVKTAED